MYSKKLSLAVLKRDWVVKDFCSKDDGVVFITVRACNSLDYLFLVVLMSNLIVCN